MSYRFVAGLGDTSAADINSLLNTAAQVYNQATVKPPKPAANITYVTQAPTAAPSKGISPVTWGIIGLAALGVIGLGGKFLYNKRVRRNPGRTKRKHTARRSRRRSRARR